MQRSSTSQKSLPVQATASNSYSTTAKNQQVNNKRKSQSQSTTNNELKILGAHDTQSDISEDEADASVSQKRRKVSVVHSYANKLPNFEYKCTVCEKVIDRYLIS